jgi:hypothetical protein
MGTEEQIGNNTVRLSELRFDWQTFLFDSQEEPRDYGTNKNFPLVIFGGFEWGFTVILCNMTGYNQCTTRSWPCQYPSIACVGHWFTTKEEEDGD